MTAMNCVAIRQNWLLVCLGVSAILFSSGCARSSTGTLVNNADLESPLESTGLPRDWSLDVAAGEYRVAVSQTAHSGKSALVLAGSGGSAEVETNSFQVPGGSVLECELWLGGEWPKLGQPTACVKFADEERPGATPCLVKIDGKSRDWQRVHFYCRTSQQTSPLSATLAIRLSGEGLIRLDDLSVKVVPPSLIESLIEDHGFEHPNEQGAFPEWDSMADSSDHSFVQEKTSPYAGKACVRLRGSGGWSVMTSHRAILPTGSRICAQGAVRAREGKGGLKIDYLKNGNCFASTISPEIRSDEWSYVTVDGDLELASQSDEIHITLGVSNPEGQYDVCFDEIDVFIIKEAVVK